MRLKTAQFENETKTEKLFAFFYSIGNLWDFLHFSKEDVRQAFAGLSCAILAEFNIFSNNTNELRGRLIPISVGITELYQTGYCGHGQTKRQLERIR